MEILTELRHLASTLRYFAVLAVVIAWGFFGIGEPTVPQRIFERVSADLLPPGVVIVGVSPLSAVNVEVMLSVVLTLLVLLPVIAMWAVSYIGIGLTEDERSIARTIILPAFLLFMGGILFGYLFLLPETFKTLYAHTPELGIEPYFLAEQFITTVLMFLFVSGCLFLIPVVMPVLTKLGLISKDAWIAGWKGAVLVILILAAVLTTDGSGVTMMLFSAPTIASYFAGMGISMFVGRV